MKGPPGVSYPTVMKGPPGVRSWAVEFEVLVPSSVVTVRWVNYVYIADVSSFGWAEGPGSSV